MSCRRSELPVGSPERQRLEKRIEGIFAWFPSYKIRVPDNWNGVLILYAHWYYLGPPPPEAEAAPGGMEDILLLHGYALAGSAFRGSGWQVKEGTQHLGEGTDRIGRRNRRDRRFRRLLR